MMWGTMFIAAQALAGGSPSAISGREAPALPVTYGDYVKACLASGGMTGWWPALGSADVYQIGSARKIDLSIWSEPGANVDVLWVNPATNKSVKSTLIGPSSMAFTATSVKISGPTSPAPSQVAWCARVQ